MVLFCQFQMDICTRFEVRPLPNLKNEDCQQSFLECSHSVQVGRNHWTEKLCPDGQKFSTKLKVCTPTCSWSSEHCTLVPGKCNCTDDLGNRWIVDQGNMGNNLSMNAVERGRCQNGTKSAAIMHCLNAVGRG